MSSLTTRLASFSLPLFAPSPPTLPQIPTLAELQNHAQALGLPKSTFTSAAPNVNTSNLPVVNRPWFLGGRGGEGEQAPPGYTSREPSVVGSNEKSSTSPEAGTGTGGRSKMKKIKVGWKRVQGEECEWEMIGSKSYAPSTGVTTQPSIGDIHQGSDGKGEKKGKEKGWWDWLTCRA